MPQRAHITIRLTNFPINSIINQTLISGQGDVNNIDIILGDGIGTDDKFVQFPILIDVWLGNPVDSLGAWGQFEYLQDVVEEGDVMFP